MKRTGNIGKGVPQQSAKRRIKTTLGAIVLLLALGSPTLLVACGNDEVPTSTITPTTPPSDTTSPPAPAILSPAEGSFVKSGSATFSWEAVSDPSGVTYTLEIHTKEDFSQPVVIKEGITQSLYTLSEGEALPDGSYWWRVRAVDGAGNKGSWAHPGFTIDTTAPVAPEPVAPKDGATLFKSPAFDWKDTSDPSGLTYSLQVDDNGDFSSPAISQQDLLVSEYTPPEDLALGKYLWRVKAVDGAGNQGGWSGSLSFTLSRAPAGPFIAHTPEGRDDCLGCHNELGIWPVPASHKGRTNVVCRDCHQPIPGGPPTPAHILGGREECDRCHTSGQVAPLPVSHDDRGPKICLMCHINPPLEPPFIAHSPERKETCTGCHGKGSLVTLPDSHDGRTDAMCQSCHDVSPVLPPPIAHTTQGRETCPACHAEKSLAPLASSHDGRTVAMCQLCHEVTRVMPPSIAHSTSGKQQCSQCHAAGKLVSLPSSHDGRTDTMCLVCHSTTQVLPTTMAHNPEGKENCTACHASQALVALPESHSGRTNVMCLLCHEEFTEATQAPHVVVGRDPCTNCHASGKLVGAPPATHQGRTDTMCLACHKTRDEGVPTIPHSLDKRGDCTFCHGG